MTTCFRGTSTRGLASECEPEVAVCLLPGTELAFADDVKYYRKWIWSAVSKFRVGKFGSVAPDNPHRHHDAIEFPDGSTVLVTLLAEGQRVTVLQLPAPSRDFEQLPERRPAVAANPSPPVRTS
jgi:hypothetical protein